jgi:hypothetical protein
MTFEILQEFKKRWELVAEVVWLHHMKNTENFYTD